MNERYNDRYFATIKDPSNTPTVNVRHRKNGHDVFTIEFPDVILTKHKFYCQVCEKTPHKIYMVKDDLWEQSELDGFICHKCFESRLGRKLTIDDLLDVPVNDWLKWQITLDKQEME